jgi:voltage-gated potassium channel
MAGVECLGVDERSERIERRFEWPIVIAAILVIPVIVIEQSKPGEPWTTLAGVANWVIWSLFLAEVVVMLAVVSDRRLWLRKHPLEIAIVVLTPPFLPASLQALRVFRLLRLLRLIAVVTYARRLFSLNGLGYGALLAAVTVLAGGAAFAHAEGDEVTTWDGVWWAMTTVTTVGYGDLYPQTTIGRLIGMLVMLVGIGFLSLLIGAVSERFMTSQLHELSEDVAEEVQEVEADVLQEIREITTRLQRLEARVQAAQPRQR